VKLIRVVAPHFVAGFESDGIVRRTAPILKQLRGMTDDRARKYIARKGWRASVIPEQIALPFVQNETPRNQINPAPPIDSRFRQGEK
jgi:hypothetical protein